MTDSKPVLNKDKPRFRKKDMRVEVALAKYYGLGEDSEGWDYGEIAEYLRVDESTVKEYLHNTELAREVEDKLAEKQARTRMNIAMKLLDRVDRLEEAIRAKEEETRPAVASHRYERVKGEVNMQKDGMEVTDEKELEFDVPVPDNFVEVPKIDTDLKVLYREYRALIQDIEDLMGLEEPEKVESEHREINATIKSWNVDMDDSGFPEAEVRNSQPSPEIEDEPEEVTLDSPDEEEGDE